MGTRAQKWNYYIETDREKEKDRERESVCVCVILAEKEKIDDGKEKGCGDDSWHCRDHHP